MVAMGHWRFSPVLLLAIVATVASDLVWFELGRRYGRRVLRAICRVALQPETSAHRAEQFLARYGARALLFAKFVPGMNRTVLPLTGTARIGYSRFLAFDLVGALVWAGAYSSIGYAFSDALGEALRRSKSLGWYFFGGLIALAAVVTGVWLVKEYRRRRSRSAELRVGHVTPHPVKQLLEDQE